MNNFILGKYQNKNTVFHRLDSRIKMLYLIAFMVIAFLPYGSLYVTLVVDGVILLLIISLYLVAKANFLYLFKSLKALWMMVIFLFVLNIFLPGKVSGDIAFKIGEIKVYYFTLFNLANIFTRVVLILAITTLYSQTSKTLEMCTSLEFYLGFLKFVKVPISKLSMAFSLALRFIPSLYEDARRIMKAQASRGVDFKNGKFKDKIKALTSLVIPLFICSFLSSDILADALISRGYDPDSKRSKYREKKIGFSDIVFLFLIAGVLSLAITQCVIRFDIFEYFKVSLPRLS